MSSECFSYDLFDNNTNTNTIEISSDESEQYTELKKIYTLAMKKNIKYNGIEDIPQVGDKVEYNGKIGYVRQKKGSFLTTIQYIIESDDTSTIGMNINDSSHYRNIHLDKNKTRVAGSIEYNTFDSAMEACHVHPDCMYISEQSMTEYEKVGNKWCADGIGCAGGMDWVDEHRLKNPIDLGGNKIYTLRTNIDDVENNMCFSEMVEDDDTLVKYTISKPEFRPYSNMDQCFDRLDSSKDHPEYQQIYGLNIYYSTSSDGDNSTIEDQLQKCSGDESLYKNYGWGDGNLGPSVNEFCEGDMCHSLNVIQTAVPVTQPERFILKDSIIQSCWVDETSPDECVEWGQGTTLKNDIMGTYEGQSKIKDWSIEDTESKIDMYEVGGECSQEEMNTSCSHKYDIFSPIYKNTPKNFNFLINRFKNRLYKDGSDLTCDKIRDQLDTLLRRLKIIYLMIQKDDNLYNDTYNMNYTEIDLQNEKDDIAKQLNRVWSRPKWIASTENQWIGFTKELHKNNIANTENSMGNCRYKDGGMNYEVADSFDVAYTAGCKYWRDCSGRWDNKGGLDKIPHDNNLLTKAKNIYTDGENISNVCWTDGFECKQYGNQCKEEQHNFNKIDPGYIGYFWDGIEWQNDCRFDDDLGEWTNCDNIFDIKNNMGYTNYNSGNVNALQSSKITSIGSSNDMFSSYSSIGISPPAHTETPAEFSNSGFPWGGNAYNGIRYDIPSDFDYIDTVANKEMHFGTGSMFDNRSHKEMNLKSIWPSTPHPFSTARNEITCEDGDSLCGNWNDEHSPYQPTGLYWNLSTNKTGSYAELMKKERERINNKRKELYKYYHQTISNMSSYAGCRNTTTDTNIIGNEMKKLYGRIDTKPEKLVSDGYMFGNPYVMDNVQINSYTSGAYGTIKTKLYNQSYNECASKCINDEVSLSDHQPTIDGGFPPMKCEGIVYKELDGGNYIGECFLIQSNYQMSSGGPVIGADDGWCQHYSTWHGSNYADDCKDSDFKTIEIREWQDGPVRDDVFIQTDIDVHNQINGDFPPEIRSDLSFNVSDDNPIDDNEDCHNLWGTKRPNNVIREVSCDADWNNNKVWWFNDPTSVSIDNQYERKLPIVPTLRGWITKHYINELQNHTSGLLDNIGLSDGSRPVGYVDLLHNKDSFRFKDGDEITMFSDYVSNQPPDDGNYTKTSTFTIGGDIQENFVQCDGTYNDGQNIVQPKCVNEYSQFKDTIEYDNGEGVQSIDISDKLDYIKFGLNPWFTGNGNMLSSEGVDVNPYNTEGVTNHYKDHSNILSSTQPIEYQKVIDHVPDLQSIGIQFDYRSNLDNMTLNNNVEVKYSLPIRYNYTNGVYLYGKNQLDTLRPIVDDGGDKINLIPNPSNKVSTLNNGYPGIGSILQISDIDGINPNPETGRIQINPNDCDKASCLDNTEVIAKSFFSHDRPNYTYGYDNRFTKMDNFGDSQITKPRTGNESIWNWSPNDVWKSVCQDKFECNPLGNNCDHQRFPCDYQYMAPVLNDESGQGWESSKPLQNKYTTPINVIKGGYNVPWSEYENNMKDGTYIGDGFLPRHYYPYWQLWDMNYFGYYETDKDMYDKLNYKYDYNSNLPRDKRDKDTGFLPKGYKDDRMFKNRKISYNLFSNDQDWNSQSRMIEPTGRGWEWTPNNVAEDVYWTPGRLQNKLGITVDDFYYQKMQNDIRKQILLTCHSPSVSDNTDRICKFVYDKDGNRDIKCLTQHDFIDTPIDNIDEYDIAGLNYYDSTQRQLVYEFGEQLKTELGDTSTCSDLSWFDNIHKNELKNKYNLQNYLYISEIEENNEDLTLYDYCGNGNLYSEIISLFPPTACDTFSEKKMFNANIDIIIGIYISWYNWILNDFKCGKWIPLMSDGGMQVRKVNDTIPNVGEYVLWRNNDGVADYYRVTSNSSNNCTLEGKTGDVPCNQLFSLSNSPRQDFAAEYWYDNKSRSMLIDSIEYKKCTNTNDFCFYITPSDIQRNPKAGTCNGIPFEYFETIPNCEETRNASYLNGPLKSNNKNVTIPTHIPQTIIDTCNTNNQPYGDKQQIIVFPQTAEAGECNRIYGGNQLDNGNAGDNEYTCCVPTDTENAVRNSCINLYPNYSPHSIKVINQIPTVCGCNGQLNDKSYIDNANPHFPDWTCCIDNNAIITYDNKLELSDNLNPVSFKITAVSEDEDQITGDDNRVHIQYKNTGTSVGLPSSTICQVKASSWGHKGNWNCDHAIQLAGSYSGEDGTPGITGDECARLAYANAECSDVINYYPQGTTYAGVCNCVKKDERCDGWRQQGGQVASVLADASGGTGVAWEEADTVENKYVSVINNVIMESNSPTDFYIEKPRIWRFGDQVHTNDNKAGIIIDASDLLHLKILTDNNDIIYKNSKDVLFNINIMKNYNADFIPSPINNSNQVMPHYYIYTFDEENNKQYIYEENGLLKLSYTRKLLFNTNHTFDDLICEDGQLSPTYDNNNIDCGNAFKTSLIQQNNKWVLSNSCECQGYTIDNDQCVPFSNNCANGTSLPSLYQTFDNECMQCNTGYELVNGQCVQKCESNYIYNTEKDTCLIYNSCENGFVNPENTDECISCYPGYTLQDGKCIEFDVVCPNGTGKTIPFGPNDCESCENERYTLLNANEEECNTETQWCTCVDRYQIYNTQLEGYDQNFNILEDNITNNFKRIQEIIKSNQIDEDIITETISQIQDDYYSLYTISQEIYDIIITIRVLQSSIGDTSIDEDTFPYLYKYIDPDTISTKTATMKEYNNKCIYVLKVLSDSNTISSRKQLLNIITYETNTNMKSHIFFTIGLTIFLFLIHININNTLPKITYGLALSVISIVLFDIFV